MGEQEQYYISIQEYQRLVDDNARLREVVKWAWGVIHDAYDQPIDDEERDEALEVLDKALRR